MSTSAECMITAQASLMAAHWFGSQVDSVSAVSGGATNLVFCVRSNGAAYYLRRYRKQVREAVEREHAFIAHCNARGVPAPLPIARASSTILQNDDGVCWAMFEAASGVQHDELTVDQARGSGIALAALHDASRSAVQGGFSSFQLSWTAAAWAGRLARIREAIEQRPTRDTRDAHALDRVRQQTEWLTDPSCPQRYDSAYPGQLIHGDYHQANLFFEGADVSAVIDWDNAVIMPRAFELVRACSFICQMDPERTRSLIEGYRAVARLTPAELEDGAAAWGAYADHHVWPLEELYLHDNAAARRFIWPRPFRPFLEEWAAIGF